MHVLIIGHMMARHLIMLCLRTAGECLLCQGHLQGHDVGGHDKAWQPANQK
jgi:hypothetical protein